MSGRLLLIEVRRRVGLWALLALPLRAWLNRQLPDVAPFWSETSVIIRNTAGLVGPLLGGAAAWMAGREARRGLGDLLATTARPQLARRLTTWAGVLARGGCAYLLSAAIIAGFSLSRATWGGPFLGPIPVGLVAVPVYAALGFALGRWFPGRFTAPFVTIALLVVPAMAAAAHGPYAFLSPVVRLNQSVWYGVRPDLTGLQLAFLLSLGGTALATAALPTRNVGRTMVLRSLVIGALVVATVALWSAAPVRGGQELSADPRGVRRARAADGRAGGFRRACAPEPPAL